MAKNNIKEGDKVVLIKLPVDYSADANYPLINTMYEKVGVIDTHRDKYLIRWEERDGYIGRLPCTQAFLNTYVELAAHHIKDISKNVPKYSEGSPVFMRKGRRRSPSIYAKISKVLVTSVTGQIIYSLLWVDGGSSREYERDISDIFYELELFTLNGSLHCLGGYNYHSKDGGATISSDNGEVVMINKQHLFNKVI